VYLKYYGAHTGRWSAGNKMNLQNLPRGSELRKSLMAPEDHVIVVADSAQIEARVLAWLADEQEVLTQFRNKEDVYKHMATQIYGMQLDEITSTQRFVGKVAVLGLGYGMGWRKFILTLMLGLMGPKMLLSVEEAQSIVNGYRRARHNTVKYWTTCDQMLQYMLYDMDGDFGVLRVVGKENRIYFPNGMYLEYPGLSMSNDGYVYFDYENADVLARGGRPNPKKGKKIYGGALAENITQALARIIVGEQILKVAKKYRIISMSHDEILALAHRLVAESSLAFILSQMMTPPTWCPDLPLGAEGGFAREYSK